MRKMKQMMAVILTGILIAGSMQISAGAAETVPMDPESVVETPFDENGMVEVQPDKSGLVETQSEEELYADSQPDESDIAEAQTDEDSFAEVQTDESNYSEETEQESAADFPVQEAVPEEESNDLEAVNTDENSISDQGAEIGTEDQQVVTPAEEFEETSFPDDADSEITKASPENEAEILDGKRPFTEGNPDEETDKMSLDNGSTEQDFQSVIEMDPVSEEDQKLEDTGDSLTGTVDEEKDAVEKFPEDGILQDLSESAPEETVADDEKFAGSNPYPTSQDVDEDGNYEVPCTRFAWQQAYDNHGISLPSWGDAGSWFQGAKNSGYSTGSVAQPCSIAVWSGDIYGHVAYVTSASGTTFTVNEGGRTDLDQTSSHGIAYGYTLTNVTGESRSGDSGKTLLGFIYLNGAPAAPTNPTISVNKTRFLKAETITIKAHADGATRYYGAIYNGTTRIWEGDCLEGGVIQYPASQFGSGQFSACVSCKNNVGSVDTGWVGYTVIEDVGDDFCAFITTNWEKEWKFLGASDEGDVRLINSDYRYHPRQIWRFKKQSNGSYVISNMYWDSVALEEGKQWLLSCEGQGTTNNTNVVVSADNGSASQKWDIYYDPNNGFTFSPASCFLVMDLTAGSTAYGTNIQLYEPNYSSAQKFDIYLLSKDNITYTRPGKPAASVYNGKTELDGGKPVALTWTESPKVNDFDKRSYRLQIFDSTGKEIVNRSGLTDTSYNYTFNSDGTYSIKVTAVNDYYMDYETAGSSKQITVGEVDKEKPVITGARVVEASRDRIVFEIDATDNTELELATVYKVTYEEDSIAELCSIKEAGDIHTEFLSPSKLRLTLEKAAIDYNVDKGQLFGDRQRFYLEVKDTSNNYSKPYTVDTEIAFGPYYYVEPGDSFCREDLFGEDVGSKWERLPINPDSSYIQVENGKMTALKPGRVLLLYCSGNINLRGDKAFIIVIKAPLTINSEPFNQFADQGSTVKMTVSASGDDLKYQWYCQKSDGSNWEMATQTGNRTASLTVTADKSYSGAKFKCIVTDAYDRTVESREAVLTVNQAVEPEEPVQITAQDVKLAKTSYIFDGTAKKPKVTVTCEGETLELTTDYTVSYKNNLNVGTATVTITGTGDYEGTVKKTFKIEAASIDEAAVAGLKTKTYTGKALKQYPEVELDGVILEKDNDYTVSFKNNKNAGTATVTITGTGNYTGTVTGTFKIKAASIAGAEVTGIKTKTYTGKALTQVPEVELNGMVLEEETDYLVSYANNTKAGTATVTITGKGNYTGKISLRFTIKSASITKAVVTCPAAKVWAGWALTPVPTVKIGSKTLTKGTDFTLAYKNNKNVGTATVTIKGKGNYTGTINRTFRINPKPTAISKVTPATGKLTLTWKKQALQTSGYQIQFSSRSDFKTQKTVKVASAAATSRALTGLTRKHKYYVRIRTYKQIGSQYYYSTWSGAKSATTK